MIRKLLFLFSLVVSVTGLKAQTEIFNESFEGSFPPTGWTLINAGSGNNWTQNTTSTYAYSGTKSMTYGYETSGTYPGNAWAISPSITLNTNPATINFFVRVRSASYPEKLKFTIGNSNTIAAQSTVLLDSSSLTNTTFRRWSVTYTPSSAGNFFLGFNCYSDPDEWNLYVDSITVTQNVPTCSGTPTGGSSSTSTSVLCSSGTTTLSLSGASAGPGITYQWQSSPIGANTWTNISGGTTMSYTATVSASSDFKCIVGCSASGLSASSSISTVTLSGAPANDDACNAITLVLDAPTQCANTTCATATGDPAFANSTPNNTIWYKYTPTTTGIVNFIMTRPSGVTSGLLYGWLGVYTATGSCPTLSFTETTSNLAFDLTTQTSVTIVSPTLTAGTTYYFMIDGFSGAFGAFCMQMITPPTPPSCTTNILPANAATNVDYLSGVKLKWNAVSGATGYDLYWGTTNPPTTLLGTTTADSVTVTGITANTTYYWYIAPKNNGGSATGCESNTTSFTTAAPPAAPANDDCASAVTISGYSGTTSGTIVSATQTSAPELCSGGTSSAALDVWYKFTALVNGDATITVVGGTGFDAVVGAYSGSCGSFTSIACIDATGSAGTETLALTGLTAGTTYYLRVYGWNTSTGTFTISASGAALPVSLISINGERKNNTNVISWATATETNNAGFELERSADGINFNKIAFINSLAINGNSNQQLNYSYVDTKPFSASGYYRLKQMDKDGRTHLSNVVIVKGIKPSKLELSSVFPNPATSEISVSVISPKNDYVTFIVYDVTGKIISKYNRTINNGDNLLKLDISNLAVGNYTIKATCADGCETALSKFVKL